VGYYKITTRYQTCGHQIKSQPLIVISRISAWNVHTPSCAVRPQQPGPFELVCTTTNICAVLGQASAGGLGGNKLFRGKARLPWRANPGKSRAPVSQPYCYIYCVFFRCSVRGRSSDINTVYKPRSLDRNTVFGGMGGNILQNND